MFFDPSITEPEDADGQLRDMGLNVSDLLSALRKGQHAYDNATPNHPRTAAGSYMWFEANRALRDTYFEPKKGWRRCDEYNLPRLIAPNGAFSFYAASGNEDTGRSHRIPTTARPRGGAGRQDVIDNLQGFLFPPEASERPPPTWLLLYCYDPAEGVIRSEFSLPEKVDPEGIILSWAKRIILPVIDLTPTADGGLDDQEPEIDIPVERRVR